MVLYGYSIKPYLTGNDAKRGDGVYSLLYTNITTEGTYQLNIEVNQSASCLMKKSPTSSSEFNYTFFYPTITNMEEAVGRMGGVR